LPVVLRKFLLATRTFYQGLSLYDVWFQQLSFGFWRA
jgi:hypothetical protein